MEKYTVKCGCGQTEFEVVGEPIFRILCHCSICQKFNAAAYADILVYKTAQVTAPIEGRVDFTTYKPPPNVQRGQCAQCEQPAIEVFNMPLMPKLTVVPAGMFAKTAQLPEPKAHLFYDKRLADAEDELPKHSGFVSSQLAFLRCYWAASNQ